MPCFLGRIAPRAGGGARGTSRRRRESSEVARRLLEGSLLIRPVKIRGFRGPGAPKHSKFACKSGGPEGGSIGSDVRLPVRTPTFSARGDVLSRHFSSLSLLPCLRLLVLPLRRPVLFRFVANRRPHARARQASCTTSAKGVLRRRPMTCPGRSHAPPDTRTTADKSKVLTLTRGAAGKSHTQDASRACAFQPAAAALA